MRLLNITTLTLKCYITKNSYDVFIIKWIKIFIYNLLQTSSLTSKNDSTIFIKIFLNAGFLKHEKSPYSKFF